LSLDTKRRPPLAVKRRKRPQIGDPDGDNRHQSNKMPKKEAIIIEDEETHISKIAVRIPPEEPELWFMQLEGQFTLCGITDDEAKYARLVKDRAKTGERNQGCNNPAPDKGQDT